MFFSGVVHILINWAKGTIEVIKQHIFIQWASWVIIITSNHLVNYLDAEENTGRTMLSGNGRHYWEWIFKLYLFCNARAVAQWTKTFCTVSLPFYLGHWSSNWVGCQCCLDLTHVFMIITVIIIFINIIFSTITVILNLILSSFYRSVSQMWFSKHHHPNLFFVLQECVPNVVFKALTWLGYSNSAFNPLIYSIFNRWKKYIYSEYSIFKVCIYPPHLLNIH